MLREPAASDWGFSRAAAGVEHLVRYAGAHDVPASRALAGTGLREVPAGSEQMVTAAQELAVVRNLRRILGEVGADVGRTYRAESFGVLGFALLASRTVLDAMDVALRFIDLSFAFAIPRAEIDGPEVTVGWTARRCPPTYVGSWSRATQPRSGPCWTDWCPVGSAAASTSGSMPRRSLSRRPS
jgi:Arabinose-binding domain of AraC transcription regulator, N-term